MSCAHCIKITYCLNISEPCPEVALRKRLKLKFVGLHCIYTQDWTLLFLLSNLKQLLLFLLRKLVAGNTLEIFDM